MEIVNSNLVKGTWKNITSAVLLRSFSSMSHIKEIDYQGVKALEDDKNVLLIDVREQSELLETGVIPGSINIPLNDIENVLKNCEPNEFHSKYNRLKPDTHLPLVFTCTLGKRSFKAAEIAFKLGFKDVTNYNGGWLDWEKNKNMDG